MSPYFVNNQSSVGYTTPGQYSNNSLSISINWKMFDLGITHHIYKWWMKGRISSQAQALVTDAILALDDECVDLVSPPSVVDPSTMSYGDFGRAVVPSNKQIRHRYASKLAIMCKLDCPGVGERNASNALVARHYFAKQMKKDNVRLGHQPAILAAALVFVFTPREDEAMYEQMEQAPEFVDRIQRHQHGYHSRDRPWLLNWFGEKRQLPPLRMG